jgi:hypothetical protein
MNSEMLKRDIYQVKKEFSCCFDEKDDELNLTELGRAHLSDDASALVLPDRPLMFSAVDVNDSLSPDQKIKKNARWRKHFPEKASKFTASNSVYRHILCTIEMNSMQFWTGRS